MAVCGDKAPAHDALALAMNARDAERSAALFAAALEMPVGQRAEFVRNASEGVPEIVDRVEMLLKAHEDSGGFMGTLPPLVQRAVTESAFPAAEQIGGFRIMEKIGEGGCGVVYRARQKEPIQRDVALKIIRRGMDTKEVIARFEGERQALALMDHPNIARVLEAGATDTGRPYFAMEWVRGQKLTECCDERRVSIGSRLHLFTIVCDAVQHAHQKGVIHRDLKPSNVLVATQDGELVPKVIDFGIAKATQGRLTAQTLFTATDLFLGTPAYMSPEQAEMSGKDVDTRSDIYSLGVLLYELLVGFPPFDPDELARSGFDEMRRRIRTEEPRRPSQRLAALPPLELAGVAKKRGQEPAQLIRTLRGDLDWIVMRCLEKTPARRYQTATDLARDIQRHLADEPVLARPPSQSDHVRKFVRRNRLAVTASALIATAAFVGVIGVVWAWQREKASRERAVVAEQTAQAAAMKSEQVTRFLREMLASAQPAVAAGRDTRLMRDILDATVKRLARDPANPPEIEAELRSTLASVYKAIGEFEKAEAMQRLSLNLWRKVPGEKQHDLVQAIHALAQICFARGHYADGESIETEALGLTRQALGPDDPQVAYSLYWLAAFKRARGDLVAAEAMQRAALAIQRRRLGDENPATVSTLEALAGTLLARGEAAEAERLGRTVLDVRRKVLGESHRDVGVTMMFVASTLSVRKDYAAAEALIRDALERRRKRDGDMHPDVAIAESRLAGVLEAKGDLAAAEAMARQALTVRQTLFEGGHPDVAASLHQVAHLRLLRGDLGAAETLERQALVMRRKFLGSAHPDVASSLRVLADIRQRQAGSEEIDAVSPEPSERGGTSIDPTLGTLSE
jgi:eukaryotic-like serine/threonine-protein kinase